MTIVEVDVFVTDELDNNDPQAKDKFESYLKDTFSRVSNYDVVVSKRGTTPNPPTEKTYKEFTYDFECFDEQPYKLLPWWRDYQKCYIDTGAADSRILLSNDSGLSGKAYSGGLYAVAAAEQISQLSTDPKWNGCSTGLEAMQTAIHEVGHNLGADHHDGDLYENSTESKYYTFHMLSGYGEEIDGEKNNCGEDIPYIDGTDQTKCSAMDFDSCSVSNFNV
jgi:hypothetical protein